MRRLIMLVVGLLFLSSFSSVFAAPELSDPPVARDIQIANALKAVETTTEPVSVSPVQHPTNSGESFHPKSMAVVLDAAGNVSIVKNPLSQAEIDSAMAAEIERANQNKK